MESVGEQLRQERLRQGLTLEDICASTRISLRNLQAIEQDDVSQISSPFFYRSFTRQFAERLGLEYSNLAGAVQNWATRIPDPAIPSLLSAPLPKVAPIQPTRAKISRSVLPVIALIAVLAGCSRLYAMWEGSRNSFRASLTSFVASLSGNLGHTRQESRVAKVNRRPSIHAPQPSENPIMETPETGSADPGADATPQQADSTRMSASAPVAESRTPDVDESQADNGLAEPVVPAGNLESNVFRIEVAAIEPTWLSIVADEKEIYSGVLEAAQTKVLEGRESARIRTGNAGGVNILFNGKTIGSLGEHGQVRTIVFTKDNYEIVEPSAEIALTSFNPGAE
ncbi:MAG: DUF4115 domain-containing protein [Acidobacteriaceae bacterium]|nr:DUF4115 domain-containing protein [Acidobacteriaceae bacterium]MBV9782161.1 DUF4115 domain-containing protein [Acidobacteriaceae bacterium]